MIQLKTLNKAPFGYNALSVIPAGLDHLCNHSGSFVMKKLYFNGETKTKLYFKWHDIKMRCSENCKIERYRRKRLEIYEGWKNDFLLFYNWAMNNGYKEGLQIDRIDNKKGYFPDNCRFVTPSENTNNRDVTIYVNYEGKREALTSLLKRLGKYDKYTTYHARLKYYGYSDEEAINKPTRDK